MMKLLFSQGKQRHGGKGGMAAMRSRATPCFPLLGPGCSVVQPAEVGGCPGMLSARQGILGTHILCSLKAQVGEAIERFPKQCPGQEKSGRPGKP